MRVKSGFRDDIQGLRAVAVTMVLLYHAGLPYITGGFIGVDIFFVISGFLITTHLLKSLDSKQLRFRDFWARRIKRLLPAAWTIAAVSAVFASFLFSPLAVPGMLKQAAATFAYVPNILFAQEGTDYFANKDPSIFQHYWSLGIEEQFYFVWPALLYLLYRLFRAKKKALLATTFLLSVISFGIGWRLSYWQQPRAFFLLPTRAWELGVGAVLAIVILSYPQLSKTAPWKPILSLIGFVAFCAAALVYDDSTLFPGYAAAVPVLGSAFVILGGTGYERGGGDAFLGRILSWAPLVFIGTISYSIYLIHWPLLIIPQGAIGWDTPLSLRVKLGLAAITIPLSWLSWRFIEQPFRTGKLWGRGARRPLLIAIIGAALLSGTALAVGYWVSTVPLQTNKTAPPAILTRNPLGTPYVPKGMKPTLRDPREGYVVECLQHREETDVKGCFFGDNPDAPLVVLRGDSHVNIYSPAFIRLAQEGKIRLAIFAKAGCGIAETKDDYPQCPDYQAEVEEKIIQLNPDLVFLATFSNSPGNRIDESYAKRLVETISSYPHKTKTVIIGDIPTFKRNPANCLPENLDSVSKCLELSSNSITGAGEREERKAAEQVGATFLDIKPWLCGEDGCPLIQGDTLVYFDHNHLTAAFAELLTPIFEDEINRVLGE